MFKTSPVKLKRVGTLDSYNELPGAVSSTSVNASPQKFSFMTYIKKIREAKMK
jgi:hypothetical protein